MEDNKLEVDYLGNVELLDKYKRLIEKKDYSISKLEK